MRYTDDEIVCYAREVRSVAGLLRKLGLAAKGGNYKTAYKHLHRLNINTDHWTGSGWSNGNQLKNWDDYRKSGPLKKILIKERSSQCQKCLRTEWFDNPIPLELHHIDGDVINNDKENLQLLCCNCHSLTDNWRAKKLKKRI